MRTIMLGMLTAASIALLGTSSTIAAPVGGAAIDTAANAVSQTSDVRDGCGRGRWWQCRHYTYTSRTRCGCWKWS